jgi:hypothetical protein
VSVIYLPGALLAGSGFSGPGFLPVGTKSADDAFALFNRASCYPLAMLVVTVLSWVFHP